MLVYVRCSKCSVNLKILMVNVNDVTCYISPLHWIEGNMGNKLYQLLPACCKRSVESSNIDLYEKVSSRSGPWLIVPEAASTY